MMNSLSGKMSQRKIDEEWQIIYPNDIGDYREKNIIIRVEPLMDAMNGTLLAYAVLRENPKAKISKPLQLGCWILAEARILMSRYLYKLHGYMDPASAYYYTDTDCLFLHHDAIKRYQEEDNHPSIFGKQLGALKDELDGGKVVRAVFLAPKTYCIEYLARDYNKWIKDENGEDTKEPNAFHGKWRLYVKTRCKGIPHTNDSRLVTGAKPQRGEKQTWYQLISNKNKLLYESDYIDMYMFAAVMFHEAQVVCCFDQFKKLYFGKSHNSIADVQILRSNRHLSKTSWWSKNIRKVLDPVFGFSVPKGHVDYQDWEATVAEDREQETTFDYSLDGF